MCGIAGYFGRFSKDMLEGMSGALASRGPDGHGQWSDAAHGVGLAHRRLSIIDLSPAGAQPMTDVAKRAVIAFNGEIYNYRELREGLARDGFAFAGHSDTEVILNLYLRDGSACLPKLNGIFAFAIWDFSKKTLLVARDGAGTKPFYWTRTAAGFAFASELKSLLVVPGLDKTLDPSTVAAHLGLLYAPGERTMLKAVRKLLPGHAMELTVGGEVAKAWKFYGMPWGPADASMSLDEAKDGLLHHLDVAVKRQLVADVPVGSFLSGGLDSSTLVHFAKENLPKEKPPECFTIEVRDGGMVGEGVADDLPYARRVAQHLGVPLHEVAIDSRLLMDFDHMVWHMDEPQPDPAALNVLHICRMARENGVTVLLSGAGGDDLLTGYRRHYALNLEKRWSGWPRFARAGLREVTSRLSNQHSLMRRLSKAFRYADLSPEERLCGYFLWLDDSPMKALLTPDFAAALGKRPNLEILLREVESLPPEATPLERMLHLDRAFFLTDHNLNYTDKMSMAAGVEVRVPFLDPDLMAFASRIPEPFKQHGKEGKWVMKEAMLRHLPREVVYRPKSGFGAPLRKWLHADLRPLFDEYLHSSRIREQGVFNPVAVKKLLDDDAAGRVDAAYPLFAVLCIDSWCRQFLH